jgi:DNA-binding transcriptional LysR family regulator
MAQDLNDLSAFINVARAGGFRDAARISGASASKLSEAVRRLEKRLGVRLLNRTTRSVAPTEAGARLIERLTPALAEVEATLDIVNAYRERPVGTLKLNVPANVASAILPPIVSGFLRAYPDIRLEVIAEDSFVDVFKAGCDAGVRYEERVEQDMIAVPIGPRVQRFVTVAAPSYIAAHGAPKHPRDLLSHRCLCGRFDSGALQVWEFERDGEIVRVDPAGPLIVQPGAAADLLISAAIAGLGVVAFFEDRLRPLIDEGALVPVLEEWLQPFSGPFLYFPSRRLLPAPLRAFIDFIKER